MDRGLSNMEACLLVQVSFGAQSFYSWGRLPIRLEKVRLPNEPWGIDTFCYLILITFNSYDTKGDKVSAFSASGILECIVRLTQGRVVLEVST